MVFQIQGIQNQVRQALTASSRRGELKQVLEYQVFQDLKQLARNALVEAEQDGRLLTALKAMPVAKFDSNGGCEPASGIPFDRLTDLRLRACSILTTASKDGRLDSILQELDSNGNAVSDDSSRLRKAGLSEEELATQADRMYHRVVENACALDDCRSSRPITVSCPPSAGSNSMGYCDAGEMAALKRKMTSTLINAADDGRLQDYLASKRQDEQADELAVEAIRMKLSSLFAEGYSNGTLEKVLAERKPSTFRPSAKEDEQEAEPDLQSIRSRMYNVFVESSNDGRLDQVLNKLVEPEDDEQEEAKDSDEEELRARVKDTFLTSANSGLLDTLLKDVRGNGSEAESRMVEPNTFAATNGQIEVYGGKKAKPDASLANHGIQVYSGMQASYTLSMLQARDRRIGELHFLIKDAEQKIAERDQQCHEMEERLSCLKGNIAHFDMDIEWHKQSLQKATERRSTLETDQRKLMMEFDQHQQKLRHHEFDLASFSKPPPFELPSPTSSFRNMYHSSGFYTPRTPRRTVLVPLQQR